MIRHLMVPITAAMLAMGTAGAYAQSAFPAPLPNQAPSSSAFPPVNGSAPVASVGAAPQSSFPVNGAAPIGGAGAFSAAPPTQAGPGEDCMKAFVPLREEAEKRYKARRDWISEGMRTVDSPFLRVAAVLVPLEAK